MKTRALLLAVCMLVTSAFLAKAVKAEPTLIRRPLAELPLLIDGWRGQLERPLSQDVLDVLRVDDYTMRSYQSPAGNWVGLYIGYHATQRQGASIHSPLNCLPGAGWVPTAQGRLPLAVRGAAPVASRDIEVNRVIIQKGMDRELVLYWYQSHGRVVASEYWGKVYSVVDAIRYNRTDAALVRIVVPIADDDPKSTSDAERRASDFAKAIFPVLSDYLPS